MAKTCKTKLLSDLPAQEDAFAGAHERVAHAIATLIKEEEGGKAIALIGSWGSGKSTVVELLRSKLELPGEPGVAEHAVFTFDAWAHQGDPLRRSFLERLIEYLVKRKWTEAKQWKDDIETLTRRKEDTETTSEPVLTVSGKLMALCVLFLPIGYALLAKNSPNETLLGFPIENVGLFLSFSPLLVALITWICWRPTWRILKKEFWLKHRAPHQDDSVVSLFMHKTRETFRSKTIRTPDPTSLEFRGIFTRILDKVLSDKQGNLVVVIDNLDRVGPEEALSIWSTMRTFFDVDMQEVHSWMSRFWLIAPFDITALGRLLGTETVRTGAEETETRGIEVERTSEEKTEDLVEVFLDKSFQVTFRVSPPVLTDWKEFFLNHIKEAFPENHTMDEFHTIYRLYCLQGPFTERPLTPRDIKLFINKIGALHRQWGDEISLPLQALYILYEDKMKDPKADVAKDDFLDLRIRSLIDEPKWQIYLAALHFNVEPERALQVLIGKRVGKALVVGDADELLVLQSVIGFLEVCEHVVEENYLDWATGQPSAIAKAAISLSGISQIEGLGWEQIWQKLKIAAIEVKSWAELDERIGKGIVEIVERCPEADHSLLSEKLVRSLSRSVPKPEKEGAILDREKAQQWVQGTLPIVIKLRDIGQGELLERDFRVIGTARSYIEVMTVLSVDGASEDLVTFYKPEEQPELIVTELGNICSKGELIESYSNIIELMLKVDDKKEWPWDQLATALTGQLDASKNLPPDQIVGCMSAIVNLVENGAVPENSFQQLAAGGHIMHYLNQAHAGPDLIAVPWCLFTILKFVPTGAVQHIGNSQQGLNLYNEILKEPEKQHPILQHLADLILRYGKIENLINQTSTAPNTKKLVTAIIEIISVREDAHQHITPTIFIEHYQDKIETLTKKSLQNLTIKLVENADLISVITENKFSKEMAGLYLQTLEATEGRERGSYIENLQEGLRELQKDDWVDELNQEGKLLELLIYLVVNEESLGLSLGLQDALFEHAKRILEGAVYPSRLEDQWAKIPDALDTESKVTFFRNLRDEILRDPQAKKNPILSIFGNTLLKSGVLEEKADDVVRQLFNGILESSDTEEIAWLLNFMREAPGILKKCKRPSRNTFNKRVQTVLRDETLSEDARPIVEDIARKVGIDPEDIVAEEAASDEDSNKKSSK